MGDRQARGYRFVCGKKFQVDFFGGYRKPQQVCLSQESIPAFECIGTRFLDGEYRVMKIRVRRCILDREKMIDMGMGEEDHDRAFVSIPEFLNLGDQLGDLFGKAARIDQADACRCFDQVRV